MEITFNMFFTKNIGTIYKDNSVDVDGLEAVVDLDLSQVNYIHVNFEVGAISYSDEVIIKDIENKIVQIPFKSDVLKEGVNKFELVATMKNGDVRPSQTCKYTIEKSLENPNNLQADTKYPILIKLIDSVEENIKKINDTITVNTNKIDSVILENTNKVDAAIASIPPKSELIGPQGPKGDKGEQGIQGMQGEKGDKGDTPSITHLEQNVEKLINDGALKIDNKIIEANNAFNNQLDNQNKDFNTFLYTKNTEIKSTIDKVEEAETLRQQKHQERETFLNNYADEITSIKQTDSKQNTRLDKVEYQNKVQDTYINGLFNENGDKRLTIEGEGTELKLEGSKEGLVQVDKIVGNTLVVNTNNEIVEPGTEGAMLKSSFEEGLVTEEMVSQGLEKAENLGKYKCKVKVRGKNLFNGHYLENLYINSQGIATSNSSFDSTDFIEVKSDTKYSNTRNGIFEFADVYYYNRNKTFISYGRLKTFTTPRDCSYVRIGNLKGFFNGTFQLEEGTVATPYEPYFERSETVYLTSPPPKSDEIVVKEDGLYHYHKMKKVVLNGSETVGAHSLSLWNANYALFYISNIDCYYNANLINCSCDKFAPNTNNNLYNSASNYEGICCAGSSRLNVRILKTKLPTQDVTGFKTLLQQNPTTVVYELAEPYYEKVADYPLTLEIPNNAILTIESFIPCDTIKSTYTGSVPSIYVLENSVENIGSQNIDIVATTWDVDFRLCEVEWVLEDIGLEGINLTDNLNMKGISKMALSRYEQAKIMIIGGAYEKETLTKQLDRYLEKGLLSQEEYDDLISLMKAKELVVGE